MSVQHDKPLVTVIMPMKNAADYVEDAIDSILMQSYPYFELIIIDDESIDTSVQIVNSIDDRRIKLIKNNKEGTAHAVNTALGVAKGKYICRCDADDLFPNDRLDWQVRWLDKHDEYGAVCSNYTPMNSDGEPLAEFQCGDIEEDITLELKSGTTRTSLCTFLTKKEVFVELKGFRPYFITSEDIDFQLRMSGQCLIWFIPQNSYYYRLHDNSITHTQASNKRVFFEETARKFLKQRQLNGQDDLERATPPSLPDFEEKASTSLNQITGVLISEAWRLHRSGKKKAGIQKGWQACQHAPTNLLNWKNLFFLILK